jgi:hypothetical protein
MTLLEITALIESFDLEWRYSHFTRTPEPPYVVYYYPSENDVKADNANYANRRQLFIELFTKTKDFDTEAAIEAKLRDAGLSWYKQTDFLNDESLFQTTYEMEVIING